jgi:hypothetical protein
MVLDLRLTVRIDHRVPGDESRVTESVLFFKYTTWVLEMVCCVSHFPLVARRDDAGLAEVSGHDAVIVACIDFC